ncbi:MAG: carboxynorspermidine decarboxylase [Clostridiaceae bacterium]|jgi:carboxynorspermidine decarboxylase|nr:carboxynorspermidine decarboxylase [Bacillota bacterium]NLN51846.1 carboxynorspermidine decarboxylase [Clostridiaceae bacterium]
MSKIPNPQELLSQQTRTSIIEPAFHQIQTPAYVFDLKLLEDNLNYLKLLAESLQIKIIFAQKSYSFYSTYPLISSYLRGSTSSGLHEALLAKEEFSGEIHVYSAAYKKDEIEELLEFVDFIYFNSFEQWQKYKSLISAVENNGRKIEVGLRINPGYSETEHDIYNPAGKFSRLGITAEAFHQGVNSYGLDGISGLHFHALCQENSASLAKVLNSFEEKFGSYLKQMQWFNFGGGHHLTRADYNVGQLTDLIQDFRNRYPTQTIYLEPGEAISLDSGFLVSEVLDIVENEIEIAILDTSATCHMPDVIEMPYTPRVFLLDEAYVQGDYYLEAEIISNEQLLDKNKNIYRLGGPTCLAGDIIGNYSFPRKLRRGDRLVFCDMALYAHVKTNTFNGMPLPDLVVLAKDGNHKLKRKSSYFDFKNRLGPYDVIT